MTLFSVHREVQVLSLLLSNRLELLEETFVTLQFVLPIKPFEGFDWNFYLLNEAKNQRGPADAVIEQRWCECCFVHKLTFIYYIHIMY
jgi:hypothetical protein